MPPKHLHCIPLDIGNNVHAASVLTSAAKVTIYPPLIFDAHRSAIPSLKNDCKTPKIRMTQTEEL